MTFNPLASLKSSNDVKEQGDNLGVGAFVFESNIYEMDITQAYLQMAASGAAALVVKLKDKESGKEHRDTFWMTSGNDKGNKTYFEKDGEKFELPGFSMAKSLTLLTVGKEIGDLVPEEKLIKLWDSKAKAEVPTKVQMYVDLIGQSILAGIIKQTVDVTEKNQSTGKYDATGKTKESNEVEKFFRARDQLTVVEIKGGVTTPTFINTWRDTWAGKVKNKAKGIKAVSNAGVAGFPATSPASENSAPAPTKSLFG